MVSLIMQMLNNAKWNITVEIECHNDTIEFRIMHVYVMCVHICMRPQGLKPSPFFAWVVCVRIDANPLTCVASIHWAVRISGANDCKSIQKTTEQF